MALGTIAGAVGFLDSIREKKAQIDAQTDRMALEEQLKRARQELKRARQGKQLAAVGTVCLFHDRVVVMERPPVEIMLSPDTKAYVDTAGAISSRVTATRLVGLGVFALAAPKRNDARELYLYVEDPAGVAMAALHPSEGVAARQLTVKLANAVIGLEAAKAAQAAEVAELEQKLAASESATKALPPGRTD